MKQRPSPNDPISRQDFIQLLEAALRFKEFKYAEQIALGWLSFFPGDLEVRYCYAQSLLHYDLVTAVPKRASGHKPKSSYLSLVQLEKIITTDPEFSAAHHLLAQTQIQLGITPSKVTLASAFILGDHSLDSPWESLRISSLKKAYQWLQSKEGGTHPITEHGTPLALSEWAGNPTDQAPDNPNQFPLAAIIQLRLLCQQKSNPDHVIRLAQAYQTRWPDTVAFKIIQADLLFKENPDEAISLLHESVVFDTAGQVSRRLLGSVHPYLCLWPSQLEVSPGHLNSPQAIAIPVQINAAMGWNQLPSPREHTPSLLEEAATSSHPTQPLIPRSKKPADHRVPPELKRIASKLHIPALGRIDGRYPVYILLTTWQGLVSQYGEQNSTQILNDLKALEEAVSRYRQWDSLIFIPDFPTLIPDRRTSPMSPVAHTDAWAIKLSLSDLDHELEKFGEMIGAVLIVGGPKVVPFHRLPNPVDDSDPDVPSDNPYSTRDENYFIPEWSIGRLPGSDGSDPLILQQSLKSITQYHSNMTQSKSKGSSVWEKIHLFFQRLVNYQHLHHSAYGYTAAIWRRASLGVFRPIGEPRNLWVCPPKQVSESCAARKPRSSCIALPKGRFAYFNLHGLPDTDEWYGQKDPAEPGDSPDFPLALRAADIQLNGFHGTQSASPEVIFTESCYGAHIQGKTIQDAISLRFLASGCRAVVGSTCISYGSISSPLIAADLLGHTFWHYLKEGQPVGEALRRAKIHLAREMYKRQGYLDGEDQKSLLSFILYGDPLVQIHHNQTGPKLTMRSNYTPGMVVTTCDRIPKTETTEPIPTEILHQVKSLMSIYLPGMEGADLHLSQERTGCDGEGHACPSARLYAKTTSNPKATGRQVITLRKTISQGSLNHTQFARMILSDQGALVKLVVSR
jgi:hypothetical protein